VTVRSLSKVYATKVIPSFRPRQNNNVFHNLYIGETYL